MELLSRLERQLARWYGPLPHLSDNARRQLSNHCWWVVLIVDSIAGIGLIGALFLALAFGLFTSVMAGIFGALVGSIVVLIVIFHIGVSLVTVVLAAVAIVPLRRRQKKGWILLFVVLLIWLVASVVEFFIHFNLVGLVRSVVFDALYGYFLFEIRDYFDSRQAYEPAAASQPLEPIR